MKQNVSGWLFFFWTQCSNIYARLWFKTQ